LIRIIFAQALTIAKTSRRFPGTMVKEYRNLINFKMGYTAVKNCKKMVNMAR
jgi:hypothetical protein